MVGRQWIQGHALAYQSFLPPLQDGIPFPDSSPVDERGRKDRKGRRDPVGPFRQRMTCLRRETRKPGQKEHDPSCPGFSHDAISTVYRLLLDFRLLVVRFFVAEEVAFLA